MTDLKNTTVPSTGSWEEQKLKLKSKFSTLTDEDLVYEVGNKDAMFERLEKKIRQVT
jgi:hypothetical protein